MMLKLIHKNEVNTFHLIDDDLYFLGVDLHCHTPRGTLERLNNSTCSISHLKDFVIFDDAHGSIRIYDRYTDKCLFSHDPHEIKIAIGFRPVLARSNKIHVAIRKGRKKTFGLLDLSDFTLQAVNFDCTFGPLKSGLVLDRTTDDNWKFFLRAVDPISGEEAWRFDDFFNLGIDNIGKEKIEEVDQIFGTANDFLWVKLRYGRIIGLDPLTGKCIKSITPTDVDITDFEQTGGEFDGPPWNSPIFLEEESRLVSLSYSRYAEIDLKAEKPVWICFDVKQEFDDKGLYAGGRKTSHQHYIYFSESMSGVLGVFDRSSKKIIWSEDLKSHNPEAGMVFEIKATDKHLYVQDNNQNLYVYEREN